MEGWVFIVGIGLVLAFVFFMRSRSARARALSDAREIQVLPYMPPEIRDTQKRAGPSPQYVFAHQLLRELVKDDRFWAALSRSTDNDDGAADHVFMKMWADCGGNDATRPKAERISGGVLVRMPPPDGITECWYVVIFPTDGKRHYYTLEKSLGIDVLCEWTDEAHVNYGECPRGEEEFIAAARKKLLQHTSN